MRNSLLYFSFLLLVVGCSYKVPTYNERVNTLNHIISSKDFKKEIIKTKYFDLFSIHKNLSKCKNKEVSIYIEGDGLAWVTSHIPSRNPTPINPVALKLALQDKNPCIIYIARPCQYTNGSNCKKEIWTNKRFSIDVIKSYNEALNKIKNRYKIFSYNLFGYSGGGAIAAIIAAKRDDISKLVTICGNLDTDYWTKLHHIYPLKGSLNPADFSKELSRVKQLHLIGGRDKIVPFTVFKSYLNRFKDKRDIKYKLFKNFNHHCCWVENWKEILKKL